MKRPLSRMMGRKPPSETDPTEKAAVAEARPDPDLDATTEKALKKAAPKGPPAGAEVPPPRVLGESKFDVVSSALMSFVIGTSFGVGWLGIMYLTMQAYANADRLPQRVEVIEVFGGGGGTLDGTPGAVEAMNVSGADASDMASNNMEDASDFEPPQVEVTSSAVIDALSEVPPEFAIDMADALPNANLVAMGKKASRIGTGKAYGTGTGPGGGIPREQRWTIVFSAGQSAQEYARQLDFLGIELATPVSAGSLEYASNFSGTPTRRIGLAAADKRLFFLWQGAGRKSSDVALLQSAGINVGNKPIFQFYPPQVEDQLSQMEVKHAGRQPAEIRATRFQVVPSGRGYAVKVLSQEPLG
jgi:hypothetical protein